MNAAIVLGPPAFPGKTRGASFYTDSLFRLLMPSNSARARKWGRGGEQMAGGHPQNKATMVAMVGA